MPAVPPLGPTFPRNEQLIMTTITQAPPPLICPHGHPFVATPALAPAPAPASADESAVQAGAPVAKPAVSSKSTRGADAAMAQAGVLMAAALAEGGWVGVSCLHSAIGKTADCPSEEPAPPIFPQGTCTNSKGAFQHAPPPTHGNIRQRPNSSPPPCPPCMGTPLLTSVPLEHCVT